MSKDQQGDSHGSYNIERADEAGTKLELLKRSCRRWEEHHNGSCCVVERVRDKYLMPKVKTFLQSFVSATGRSE